MKIIIAPDSFKGSLTNLEAAIAIERGVRTVMPGAEIDVIPMADGGEGTLEALVTSTKGQFKEVEVFDPLGRSIIARYGILRNGQTAIIEMAEASGLLLLKKEERNPLLTSTYGTGQLIVHALEAGYRELIIALGGSATNDGGAGMAQALGVRFFMKDRTLITKKLSGGILQEVEAIDISGIHPAIKQSRLVVACDVRNPLLGEHGCSMMYAPQKGASPEMVQQLEKNMEQFISIAEKTTRLTVRNIPGSGAAGGLGAGLILFSGAEALLGVEIVMDACGFTERIKNADLILTGEGKIDKQTIFGKSIAGIASRAKEFKIPVIAFAGILENEENLIESGISRFYSITPESMSVNEAMKNAAELLQKKVEQVMLGMKYR
jgi:glycerate 2-kinase